MSTTPANSTASSASAESVGVLPNLCNSQSVFLLVLVGELLAVLLTLSAPLGLKEFDWDRLAYISVQVQWVILLSAIGLCRLGPWLAERHALIAGSLSYGLVLVITAAVSLAGQWIVYLASSWWLSRDEAFSVDMWNIANNLAIAAILAGILLRYLFLQQQLRRQQHAEMQSRIRALQARIQPHFLFNSMNSIASLIGSDPDTAERMVEDLAELFRASLAEPDLVPLERELALCKHYLAIESLRLGGRLRVNWEIDATITTLIPSLLLQPLVENAILHGIEPLRSGGVVTIAVGWKEGLVRILITNPYPDPAVKRPAVKTQTPQAEKHNRMALDNVESRLLAHFGPTATLHCTTDAGVFSVEIVCPRLAPKVDIKEPTQ